ncbi:hypothetical protein CUJ84_pRLN2000172 (plasmid) [Rhizobium leguminosarum]|uniref:Uncharacterized protein n=1 Tax=Rhizobium leguminosarum TaxID=384 RepID=A0A2K9ZEM7_RHILE|nr:hypothetical protein CUJ84_pRLN2000172 [Rhizobium leguminosarum]
MKMKILLELPPAGLRSRPHLCPGPLNFSECCLRPILYLRESLHAVAIDSSDAQMTPQREAVIVARLWGKRMGLGECPKFQLSGRAVQARAYLDQGHGGEAIKVPLRRAVCIHSRHAAPIVRGGVHFTARL